MPRALDITVDVDSDGRLPKSRTRQLREYLRLFADGRVRIRISKPKRSTQANAYWWSVVLPTIQRAMFDAGMTASTEAIHIAMKRRYLPSRPAQDVFGEPVVLEPTTTELDSTEFFEFVESVRYDPDVLALGCDIPDPDPNYRSYRLADVG